MNLYREYDPAPGATQLAAPGQMGLKLIDFGILRLAPDKSHHVATGTCEVVLVVLNGQCAITVDGNTWDDVGERNSVFDGTPHAFYAPPGAQVDVTGLTDVELAVCKAPARQGKEARLIAPGDVNVFSRGRDNFYRDVYAITDFGQHTESLMVGETISGPGNWCSWPPHKHDLEELYYYKLDQPHGFGIQRVYTDDRSLDETCVVTDNSLVAIPRGYHPLVVAPTYRAWFIYVIAGNYNEPLIATEGPDHEITSEDA